MTRITYKAPAKEEREQLECMMKKVREKLIRFGLVACIECRQLKRVPQKAKSLDDFTEALTPTECARST